VGEGGNPSARGFVEVTIASGESLSAEAVILGWSAVSIEQPAGCEGTKFSAQGSLDGNGDGFADIQDANAEWFLNKSATEAQLIIFDAPLQGLAKIKIRSGKQATPTAQNADVTLKIGLVKL